MTTAAADSIASKIEAETAEIMRALITGMALQRYCEMFQQPRPSAYAAIARGELDVYKLGARTWLTGESIARRHRLEHLLANKKDGTKVDPPAPSIIIKERRQHRRSS